MSSLFSGALWKHADFLRLWSAQTISDFGARIAREGLPLTAVLTIDASPAQLGVLAALTTAPAIAVGMFAGGTVDRSRKRGLLIATDIVRMAVLFTVPLAAWFHLLTVAQLFAVAALVGGASALFDIADHAYLPSLIGREHLMEGNSKIGVTESVAEIGGPAFAGLLVQFLTAPFAMAANALTYGVSALLLLRIRTPEQIPETDGKKNGWRSDLKAALEAVWTNVHVRPLWLMALTFPLFGGFFGALYILYAIKVLEFTPALLGGIIAVGGGAALTGALCASWLTRRLGYGPAIILSAFLSASGALLIPLADGPLWLRVVMMMGSQLLGDSFGVAMMISAVTLRQSLLPRDMLGRSAALFQACAGITAVCGGLAGGFLGGLIGVRNTLLLAVLFYMATPLIGLLSPLRHLTSLPEPPP